jgi:hypothetical protein
MRFLPFAFLLLGYSIGLSCNSGSAVRVSDEDIAEAVFRFQIERCYEANPPKVYFLSFRSNDPTGEFMARFRPNGKVVRKRSQMSSKFTDLESGERGIVLSVGKLIRLSETKFEVEGACVANGLNGYGFTYSVIRDRDGGWRVGSRLKWIS